MRHRRKIKPATTGRPNSDINVTPLVDVVLVLLIIFMVVTPLLEKEMEVRVPSTEQVPEQIEVPQDQLVISVNAKGEIALNSKQLTEENFQGEIESALKTKPPGEKIVFVMADEHTNYGHLISVLDRTKAAGAETMGMLTESIASADAPPAPGKK